MNSHHHHQHSADADSVASAAAAGGGGSGGVGGHQHNHHPHHPPPPPDRWHADDPSAPLIRLMCSYGGRILPRPHDNQLRYVGGETRIAAIPRSASFAVLLSRLSKLAPGGGSHPSCLKYQLPHEDLDALVSLTSDEDVENMFDEYDRLAPAGGRAPRLRLFLFPQCAAAFGSVVDAPASTHDQWFVDALNGRGSGLPSLDRGRSEVSSIISEVPDYLFGLDNNSDEPPSVRPRAQPTSDPGSPFSASSQLSVPTIPHLPPVKTKPNAEEGRATPVEPGLQQQTGLTPNPAWSYVPEPATAPVFYMPNPVHRRSQAAQQVPMAVQYVHSLGPMSGGQMPMWFQQPFCGVAAVAPVQGGPVYVGGPPIGLRAAMQGGYGYPAPAGAGTDAYETPASVLVYQGTGVPLAGGDEMAGPEMRVGKPAQSNLLQEN